MNKELAIQICQNLIKHLKGRIELLKQVGKTEGYIEIKDAKRLLRKYMKILKELME